MARTEHVGMGAKAWGVASVLVALVMGATAAPAMEPQLVAAARSTGVIAFEPTITARDGRIFFSHMAESPLAIPGLGTSVGGVFAEILLMRSDDAGRAWTDVTPRIGGETFPIQSNDPYVWTDPATGRTFLLELQGACTAVLFSDDGGATWLPSALPCTAPQDHPTIWTSTPRATPTAGYPSLVHLCVNAYAGTVCTRSLDGGLTFGPIAPVVLSLDPSQPGVGGIRSYCSGLMHHGTSGADGVLYIGKGHCGTPVVARSLDDGLSWTAAAVTEGASMALDAQSWADVSVAVDEVGSVYASWIDEDHLPTVAVSRDGGVTWSAPFGVAAAGVAMTDFMTVAAGAEGRIAVSYLGTTSNKPYGSMEGADTWQAYLAVVEDALAPVPTVRTTVLHDPADPIARGVCGGSRCYADGLEGGAGDFLDLIIDEHGRPWAALVDNCRDICRAPSGTENSKTGLGLVGTLAAGPRLRGPAGPLPPLE